DHRPLAAGDRIVLVDSRGRRYLLNLADGGVFHWHGGTIAHDEVIGQPEGTRVRAPSGAALTAFRPRLADFVLKMGRGAQVIYPKDLGPMLIYGDVYPGASVLEAGTGSGALTMALCRAVGAEGRVVSCELRPGFADVARRNIGSFFGSIPPQLELRTADVRELDGERFDRMLLDLPDPWAALPAATRVLEPGGVFCAYLPTTAQVQSLVLNLEKAGFGEVETFEVLHRSWHVSARSVRPDHRMVGHTGFLTTARRTSA
ncbi:MAG TPA: tRNA (adenine-N1)-methyltransferase, partial [Actinomycetota bacterium]|nr:tRNA (adenine-N1)-methyltransferase [Actinomycetota bacterium]